MWKRTRKHCIALLILLLFGSVACGGGKEEMAPGASTTDEINISLTTNPNPPASGQVQVIVTLTDVAGQTIDNADVYILGGHTEMGGMNLEGEAVGQGNGRYTFRADFSMSGDWLVTVEVRDVGTETIRQEFDLPVQ